MSQRLIVDVEKCTECRSCQLKCSFVHFGLFNLNKSGVQIQARWPAAPVSRVCLQCEDPACLPACPVDALFQTGAGEVKVLYDECSGCGSCVEACPYDGVWLDPLSEVAIKCDTCDGEFRCVAECFAEALSIGE